MTKPETSLRSRVVSGLFWSSFANWGQGVISLLVFMVLARLLGPHDLGVYAAVMVVISFIQMFSEQGLGEAIIQRPEITPPVLNAVALINLGLALLILLVTWLAAPLIAERMGIPDMEDVLRVVVSAVLISALSFAQQAMLRRHFNYRWLSISSLTGTVVAGAVAIAFAFMGFGVWSLVIQTISAAIVTNLMIWSRPQWQFRFQFDFRGVMPLIGFGSKRLGTNLLDLISTRYVDMFIGATFGAVALGIYAVGMKIYQAAMQVIVGAVLNVVLNGFSRLAHDRAKLVETYYRSVGMMTATISAVFVMAAFLAPELTRILFGEQFAESARIMELAMLWGAVQSVMWCTGTAFNAIGRSSITLVMAVVRASVIFLTLLLVHNASFLTVVASFMAAQLAVIPLSLFVARAVLNISLKRLAAVVMPAILALLVCGGLIYLARQFEFVSSMENFPRLVLLGALGGGAYVLMLTLTARNHVRDMYLALKLAKQGA